ncbi:MAG: toll/interleukin-1 receptor domain-containing protein [Oscillospiraceae bacterium]
MLVDFFAGTGISKETVFCSSLPGNDINERISDEVKSALKSSAVNIAVLSHDYYQSAYCLNEAGVLWYEHVPVIPVALPEINSGNMYGFLNNEYKLRRLDSDTDISYIYDTVSEAVSASHTRASLITYENKKLRTRYAEYLKSREIPPSGSDISIADTVAEITTDDERIVLYYILHENVRKVSEATISNWLNKCEIRGVNVDNAFDLLSSFDNGAVNNNTLEFGIDTFRKYSANAAQILPPLKQCGPSAYKISRQYIQKNLVG